MRHSALALGALLPLTLAACNFAPAYQRPATPAAAAYQDAPPPADGAWQAAAPKDDAARGHWWTMYRDPTLDALEDRVAGANQDIAAALARYDEARAALGTARSALFPAIGANGDATRQRVSQTIANARPDNLYNDYALNADFGYELDLWGRVRNSVAEARANAAASRADLAAMDLDSHADLAADYFALRGDDSAIRVLDDTVAANRRALRIVQNRFHIGTAAGGDLDQAQAALDAVETQAADTRLKRAALEHAIAILVGASAANFTLAPATFNPVPPPIDAGVPANLLERRPDVAAAERRVMATNANIGVARAAYFPAISLNALLGGESATAQHIFTAPSRVWSLGPSMTLPLFEGGAIVSATAAARAERDEAVANYRNIVLGALRDVEDNLVASTELASEAQTAAEGSQAAEKAYGQARNLYAGGITTYLDVLVPQTNALQARLTMADVQARRLQASVQLIKALGGGWVPD